MESFFKRNRVYAVAGASANPSKYGYKVLNWYKMRDLPATPINPKSDPILGLTPVQSIRDVSVPPNYDLAVSVITPPAVTKELIENLSGLPVKAIWLQPGTHNPEIVQLAKNAVPNVITDCILVNGDKALSKERL